MIELKTQKGTIDLKAIGSNNDIFADTMVIIKSIYKAFAANDKESAEEYRKSIADALTNPASPFFKEVPRD